MEQRRTKRFALELPLEIVKIGSERLSQPAITRNIGSGGVLFFCPRQMEIGGPVEYIVTLTSAPAVAVSLKCMGKILRLKNGIQMGPAEKAFEVAVSLERYEFQRMNGHSA